MADFVATCTDILLGFHTPRWSLAHNPSLHCIPCLSGTPPLSLHRYPPTHPFPGTLPPCNPFHLQHIFRFDGDGRQHPRSDPNTITECINAIKQQLPALLEVLVICGGGALDHSHGTHQVALKLATLAPGRNKAQEPHTLAAFTRAYSTHHTNKPGWSHAWVLHGPEGSAVVSLNTLAVGHTCWK